MHLSTQTLNQWITDNKYQVPVEVSTVSRCIDGRYPKGAQLAPLAIPGADVGQMAIILSAAYTYGFEVDIEGAYEVLSTLSGPAQQASSEQSPDRALTKRSYCAGCGHVQLLKKYPTTYHIDPDQLDRAIACFTDHPTLPDVVLGRHHETAVVVIRGSSRWSVYSQDGALSAFVAHKALVDARHKILSDMLIAKNAVYVQKPVVMFEPETLYEYLSSVYDEHLTATLAYLAVRLPLYYVTMHDDGSFAVESRGEIEGFVGGAS